MAGFMYKGKNIGDFGEIYYIPNESERGAYALPYKVEEQENNGHDGAYYSGCHVQPREWALRCYYEDLTQETKEEILRWFGRNTYGQLVFDDRNYAYYDVRPNGRVTMQDHYRFGGLYHGIMTIPLKAYCPFGHLLAAAQVNMAGRVGDAVVGTAIVGADSLPANNETLILTAERMPTNAFTTSGGTYVIYNPGTERTPLTIRMAGTATSGVITNLRNGQNCGIINMTESITSGAGKYLQVDSETGRVTLTNGSTSTLAFDYHDYGYIWLEPCTPFVRDAVVRYESGSKFIHANPGIFTYEMVGQYVYLDGAWRKFTNVYSAQNAKIVDTMNTTGSESTQIVTMNELQFTGFNLSAIELSYSPRVR